MFTIPKSIPLMFVKDFASDEVHVTGKATGNPSATLSFVAVDDAGQRVPGAPVAVVTLTGEAYNQFNERWTDETSLYKTALELVVKAVPGSVLSGVDLAKAGGLTATQADEVVAE